MTFTIIEGKAREAFFARLPANFATALEKFERIIQKADKTNCRTSSLSPKIDGSAKPGGLDASKATAATGAQKLAAIQTQIGSIAFERIASFFDGRTSIFDIADETGEPTPIYQAALTLLSEAIYTA